MKNKLICVMSLTAVIIFTLTSCKTKDKMMTIEVSDKLEDNNILRATAPVIIYKTIRDFSDYVPVIMNEDKTAILSYPDRMDIFSVSSQNKPIALSKGYLLDNRGINENAAYLKLTYEAYNNLENTPNLDELIGMILEKNPLVELYYCGNLSDYKDFIPELNSLIERGFPGCKKADIFPMKMQIKVE